MHKKPGFSVPTSPFMAILATILSAFSFALVSCESMKMEKKTDFLFKPIGFIKSPFKPGSPTPRQGCLKPDVPATIEIEPAFEKGLKDLEGFSYIHVLYLFDQAESFRILTQTPWGKEEHGVFATRSFRRPNPIGLTVVKLVKRQGRTLYIEGIDAFDGTPVLDIKPYIPPVDSIPHASIGWLSGLDTPFKNKPAH